jgi:hypothetical protein
MVEILQLVVVVLPVVVKEVTLEPFKVLQVLLVPAAVAF